MLLQTLGYAAPLWNTLLPTSSQRWLTYSLHFIDPIVTKCSLLSFLVPCSFCLWHQPPQSLVLPSSCVSIILYPTTNCWLSLADGWFLLTVVLRTPGSWWTKAPAETCLLLTCGLCWLMARADSWFLEIHGSFWTSAPAHPWVLLTYIFCWHMSFAET